MNPRRRRRRQRTSAARARARVATAVRDALAQVTPDLAASGIPRHRANWGWCEDVAYLAQGLLLARHGLESLVLVDDEEVSRGGPRDYRETPWTHAWLWVAGRHHDAEAVWGVERFLDLPHFRRWNGEHPESPIEAAAAPGVERRRCELSVYAQGLVRVRMAQALLAGEPVALEVGAHVG